MPESRCTLPILGGPFTSSARDHFLKSFLPVVAALQDPLADFVEAHGLRTANMEQSFDFPGKQRDNGIRKILTRDAASVLVVKQRHGKTSFEPAFDEIDRALFALYGIAHGKSYSDNRVPGSFCDFLFRKHIRFSDHADGIRPVRFRVSARRCMVARENQVGTHIQDVTGIRKNRNDAPCPVCINIVRILWSGLANIQIADPGCVEHMGRPKIIPDPRQL